MRLFCWILGRRRSLDLAAFINRRLGVGGDPRDTIEYVEPFVLSYEQMLGKLTVMRDRLSALVQRLEGIEKKL